MPVTKPEWRNFTEAPDMIATQNESILIVTEPADSHASAAVWALLESGYRCQRWYPEALGKFPVTVWMGDGPHRLELQGPDGDVDVASTVTVWLRRFGLPIIPESIAFGDRSVARRECDRFLRGVLSLFGDGVRLINPPTGSHAAASKAHQLRVAKSVGLRIPRTVMTNDAGVARSFIRSAPRGAIYKAFMPAFWKVDSTRHYSALTSMVTERELDDPDSLLHSPGIFQEYVPKRSELRIAVFGEKCIAAEITEQHATDFRADYESIKCSPYDLPGDVEQRIRCLMANLGLRMGSLDMILTPEGDHVFLEVNPQGQFLWVEEKNPDILLLDQFVRFLIGPDSEQRDSRRHARVLHIAEYFASQEARNCEREFALQEHGPFTSIEEDGGERTGTS